MKNPTRIFARCLPLAIIAACGCSSVNAEKKSVCTQTALKKSQRMIQYVLDDLTSSYNHVGGGGIAEIKLVATRKYRVSLLQEERIDQITYELALDSKCKIRILDRKSSTQTR